MIGCDPQAFVPLLFVGLEIPFAPVDITLALKRQDMGCDAIEEPAIMADDDDAPCIIENGLLQSPQRVHVEIIGWFVQ